MLVALVDLADSDELRALVLPVNVRDVTVVEVDGAAAGAALTVGGAGAATGAATGATAATGNGVTLSATDVAGAAQLTVHPVPAGGGQTPRPAMAYVPACFGHVRSQPAVASQPGMVSQLGMASPPGMV